MYNRYLSQHQRIWIASSLLAFLLGAGGTYLVMQRLQAAQTHTLGTTEVRESGYTYINPLLECEFVTELGSTQIQHIQSAIAEITTQKQDQSVSVYYRDLLNGPWYGYNEDAGFAPQSLLKLPVIIAYLKIADEKPGILEQKITYATPLTSNLSPENSLQLNTQYTVQFLIERTMQHSDNVAFHLLTENLPSEFTEKVHQDLNIPYPNAETPTDFVSVRSYSSIFRVLYNSSYLSRKNSEYLLRLLHESDFPEGLVAGVPASVMVAHKFGIRTASESDPKLQLHDCGVIYHPDTPYLLCVMTKGTDFKALTATIQQISQAVYTGVTNK